MSSKAKVNLLMQKLGITEEDALDVINYDYKVDHNQPTEYDLTKEQESVVREMKNSETHLKSEQKISKPKQNPKKENIIALLSEFLEKNLADSVEITNKTREICFKIGEDDYKLALSATRKPKK